MPSFIQHDVESAQCTEGIGLQVSKQLWEEFRLSTEVYAWFDYSESGNKQVTIVYSHSLPTTSGKKALLPWEPGSMLPPFLIQMQQEAEAAAQNRPPEAARDTRQRKLAAKS